MKKTTSLLVGYDLSDENEKSTSVLIIATKDKDGSLNIINAFKDKEATELYNKLITKKGVL